jgi:hypothetical protein
MNTEALELHADIILPPKNWFTLREACELKNLNYKTACNRPKLQPNFGKMDGRIGDRKNECVSILNRWILSAKVKKNIIAQCECEKLLRFINKLT